MRSNASLLAVLFLLSACGGGRGYSEYPLETAGGPPPQGSVAAQAWNDPRVQQQPRSAPGAQAWDNPQSPESETWRAADGTLRTRQSPSRAAPVDQPVVQAQSQPGASYAAPGPSYAAPAGYAAPAPQQSFAPPPPQDGYADPAAGAAGPSGSSRPGPGEVRYDEIGYAGVRDVAGGGMDQAVVAVHRSLPANSYVEVTSLDTGRTILVLITGAMEPGADHPIDLSAGAARQLGLAGQGAAPVRIRRVNPSPVDQTALRSGRPAMERPATPPVLLNALRRQLPGVAASAPIRSAAPPSAAPVRAQPGGRGYFVQVAALSNARNAQALAQSMGGFVKPGGGLYRVQMGPFATSAQAQAARQRAAGAGYSDARVFAN